MSVIDLFWGGGIMMWPLLFIGIGIVAVTVRAATRVRSARAVDDLESGLLPILFWGTMALVLGLLGTVVGLIQMGYVIQLSGSVNSTTVWGGITVALITLGFGLLLFILAMGSWYVVRMLSTRTEHA